MSAQGIRRCNQPNSGPASGWETIRELRPEVRSTLERSEQILGLAASFAVFLAVSHRAGAAPLPKTRARYGNAVPHAGAGQRQTLMHFVGQFFVLALIACVLGVLLAFAGAGGAGVGGARSVRVGTAGGGLVPLAKGFLPPAWCCYSAAIPPLVALAATPPVRALRRDMPTVGGGGVLAAVLGAVAVLAVVLMQSQDWQTGAIFVGGLVALVGVATLLAALLLCAFAGWCAAVAWRGSVGHRAGPTVSPISTAGASPRRCRLPVLASV